MSANGLEHLLMANKPAINSFLSSRLGSFVTLVTATEDELGILSL
jgi:hypothetical protein